MKHIGETHKHIHALPCYTSLAKKKGGPVKIPNQNLRIPGPTPCPDEIMELMSSPMINHRGPEFKDLLFSVTDRLKRVFQTDNDLYVLTASGTGALEASLVNTLSPRRRSHRRRHRLLRQPLRRHGRRRRRFRHPPRFPVGRRR